MIDDERPNSSVCAPADPNPRAPRFRIPDNAVDCHAHIFGPTEQYPYSRDRTYTPPDWLQEELREAGRSLGLNPDKLNILDGGLLDQKHAAIKDTLVIWDILVRDGEHLLDTTYSERYDTLVQTAHHGISSLETWWYNHKSHEPVDFGYKLTDHVILAKDYPGEDLEKIWRTVETVNAPYTIGKDVKPLIEGVLIKNPHGKLELGFTEKNNGSWMAKSRVKTGRHNH